MRATVRWGNDVAQLAFRIDEQCVRLTGLTVAGRSIGSDHAALPITELRLAGDGNAVGTSERMQGGGRASRLRHREHREGERDGRVELEITVADEGGVVVHQHYTVDDHGTVRAWSTVENEGRQDVTVHAVSSLLLGGLTGGGERWATEYRLRRCRNSWFAELEWGTETLPDLGLADHGLRSFGYTPGRAVVREAVRGTWSSSPSLPAGMLTSDERTLLWQIEHSGGWEWEIGDHRDDLYLLLLGPHDQTHQWRRRLSPGERVESVPVLLTLAGDADEAFGRVLRTRRALRRTRVVADDPLPVVANDFMNGLMGDPSHERLSPLVASAGALGAEVFCVDAGWFASPLGWWDTVGQWEPDPDRFPHGIEPVLEEIRAAGMIPGLWLEPEVIGVHSPLARSLPDSAFFSREGHRVTEAGRHQLDLRDPAARAHLDAVVDRLVSEYGVGYLKLDDNIDVTTGTDGRGDAPGDGALQHQRAHLDWLEAVHARHPQVILENCASGGQRMDGALLARVSMQSMTDQQDAVRLMRIAAASASAVPPEQAAWWSFPRPEMSDHAIALTMAAGLLGRIHLGGRHDLLTPEQRVIVHDALAVYRAHRDALPGSTPWWPLGLPAHDADVVASGLVLPATRLLLVANLTGQRPARVPLPDDVARGRVERLFPRFGPDPEVVDGELVVSAAGEPAAMLVSLG